MFTLLSCFCAFSSFSRDRRAAIRQSAPVAASRTTAATTRSRKGVRAATKTLWRRADTGSNHISAYGVWRDRSRRAMTRANRTGETRWHQRPVPGGLASRCAMQ